MGMSAGKCGNYTAIYSLHDQRFLFVNIAYCHCIVSENILYSIQDLSMPTMSNFKTGMRETPFIRED
jgi:hypothetical protein